MCGFLVVGSEEFKLQEFNDALEVTGLLGDLTVCQLWIYQQMEINLLFTKIVL